MPFLIGSRSAQGSAELRSTMIGLRAALDVLLTAAALTTLAGAACAQGNFEIQVYGSETVAPGTTMFELHSNSAIQGTTRREDGVLPTQHAVHETLEITHGWTSWFETGFYLFTSVQTLGPDQGYWWVGNHIRPRVRAPEEWHLPVGLSLSLEVGYQQREFSPDTWTLEIRPIIDKQWGRWYFAINPAFEQSLKGPGTKTGIEFTPAAKVSYDLTKVVSPGVEYYGTLGPVGNFPTTSQQQHQLYAVVDLNVDPRWEINFGVGAGLTRATDGLIIKMILGRRF
jgi:hypothetical protein